MTTVGNKSFGNARSVFERNATNRVPASPFRRASTSSSTEPKPPSSSSTTEPAAEQPQIKRSSLTMQSPSSRRRSSNGRKQDGVDTVGVPSSSSTASTTTKSSLPKAPILGGATSELPPLKSTNIAISARHGASPRTLKLKSDHTEDKRTNEPIPKTSDRGNRRDPQRKRTASPVKHKPRNARSVDRRGSSPSSPASPVKQKQRDARSVDRRGSSPSSPASPVKQKQRNARSVDRRRGSSPSPASPVKHKSRDGRSADGRSRSPSRRAPSRTRSQPKRHSPERKVRTLEKSTLEKPTVEKPALQKPTVEKTFLEKTFLEKTAGKNMEKVVKGIIRMQALFRGLRQRSLFALLLQHNRKEKELLRRLEEIKMETKDELGRLEESVETYKSKLRTKLEQRRAKHQDKVEFYERNKHEMEQLRKENAQFRSRNDVLKENCRKLQLKNLRLEKSMANQEEYTTQIKNHHDHCKEDNERLLEVQASYRKKLDQLQQSLDTRTAYAVSENRIKISFRKAIADYVKMVESCRHSNNINLLESLHHMVQQVKSRDKTPNKPCPYEEPVGAGGQLDADDSTSSWLHSPPRLSRPKQDTEKAASALTDVAALPVSGSSDDESYVFDDSSAKSGSTNTPVALKRAITSTSAANGNKTSSNNVQRRTSTESAKRQPSPSPKSRRRASSRTRSQAKDGGVSDDNPSTTDEENESRIIGNRRRTKVAQSPVSSKGVMSKVGKQETTNPQGRRKPKLPQLRPTARKPSPTYKPRENRRSSSKKTTDGMGDDGSTDSSRSTSSSDEEESDDSQREFDRSYQASIARAATKLGGGRPAPNPPPKEADPDEDSPGWSSGDSDTDSESEFHQCKGTY